MADEPLPDEPCAACNGGGYIYAGAPCEACNGTGLACGYLTSFYADPVDKDGNVIATVTGFEITHSPWPMRTVKIPASEITGDLTFQARIGDDD